MHDENLEEHEERRPDLGNDANESDGATAGNMEGITAAPRRNRASNLTEADRRRGGQSSARAQIRDAHGQFAGRAKRDGEDKGGARRGRRTKSR